MKCTELRGEKTCDMISRKSMLYKSDAEYGDYAMNHALGCAHGCMFPCYAFSLKRGCGQVHSYHEWREPRIVENTLELLDRKIPRLKGVESVHLCFATDPFIVGYPQLSALSLVAIAKLHAAYIRVQTLTKGVTPYALTDTETYYAQHLCGFTLVSIEETFRQRFEPYSASYPERIGAPKVLHDRGLIVAYQTSDQPEAHMSKDSQNNELDIAERE